MKLPVTIVCLLFPLVIFSQAVTGTILSVQDGDSFNLLTPDSIYRVRLFGIDCPEINQAYGVKAKDFLDRYMSDTVVILKKDIDKYGRTVAEVYYRGSLINLALIKSGLAWHFKKYSSDSTFANAEVYARKIQIGIWSEEKQIAPWDWRSGNYDYSIVSRDSTNKVFICVGKEEANFHMVHFCENLKICKSSIILVTPNEAMGVFFKTKCSMCIK